MYIVEGVNTSPHCERLKPIDKDTKLRPFQEAILEHRILKRMKEDPEFIARVIKMAEENMKTIK